jgi:hypothetical protein
MTQSQFIQRLKQQPRLGITAGEIQAIFNAISDGAKGATALLEQNIGAFLKYNTALTQVVSNSDFQAYLTGIEKQIAVNETLNKRYKEVIDRSLIFEKRNKALNKTFGIGSNAAAKMSQGLSQAAASIGITSKESIKYATNIKKVIPVFDVMNRSTGEFYTSLMTVQRALTTNLELTAEQAEEYSYYASQNDRNAVTQLSATQAAAASIEKATGMSGAFKDIVTEIAAAGADTQLQFGRIPGSIELASLKAKSLGFTLDQMSKSGQQMLDIESSIGKELEYQLLSGHRLVDQDGKSLTNKIREAQLRGDMNAQMDAMNTLLENEGDVLENNMIARKGMADLLGIDEKSLSRAIQKKKMLASMGVDEELFKLSGDALTSAADKMLKGNEISQDQFDEIIAFSDDQRTTDELIEEQNEIAEDNRLANILQLDQASLQAKAAFEAAEGNRVLQGQLMNEIQRGNEAYVASIGRAVQMRDIGQGLTKEALKAQVLDAKASDPNAKVNNTGDLLYIPNQSLTTSGYGEMFELDRRDAVMAGPSNYIEAATQGTSKGANVALLATAIVDALKGATFTVDPGALATFFNNAT